MTPSSRLARIAEAAGALGMALALVLACDGGEPAAEARCEASIEAQELAEPVRESADVMPTDAGDEPAPVLAAAEPSVHPPAAPPPWRDASGVLIEPDHWLPGPARHRDAARDPEARLALDEGCRRCHTRAAHEWLGSQHAGAWSGTAFQRAFAIEPRAFCQRCHAPEEPASTPVHEVSPAAASLGVGCVTCHVEPGTDVVWAAPRNQEAAGAISADRTPHPVARSVAFTGPQACARCHEFPFPDAALRERPLAMQSTITEHARSAAADRSCADCHMPRDADGDRSHAFAGAYDRATLAKSLAIEATREGAVVRLRLRPGEVGHAVPTGDLLRRLMVEVRVDGPAGPDDAPAFSARRWYGRRFGPLHQQSGLTVRGEHGDDRVGVGVGPDAGAREASFELPAALASQPVRWRIVHQRVAQHTSNPRAAIVEGELEFAGGVLDPS